MAKNITKDFIEKLKEDTINHKLTWTNMGTYSQNYFERNIELRKAAPSYAHSVIAAELSYVTLSPGTGFIYLLSRRSQDQSGLKIDAIDSSYELYIQKHEIQPCYRIEADQLDLVSLATIVHNNTETNEAAIANQQTLDFMQAYLDSSSEENQ